MATSSKTSRIINIISNQKSEVSQHIHTAQAHRDGSLFSGHALQAAISPWLMAHRAISNWRLWKIMSKCSVILNTGKKIFFNFFCQHVIHLQWGWARSLTKQDSFLHSSRQAEDTRIQEGRPIHWISSYQKDKVSTNLRGFVLFCF